MKKFIALFILSALFLQLAACGSDPESGKTPPRMIYHPRM